MTVGEFCNREVITTSKDASLIAVSKLMRDYNIGSVVIVESKQDTIVPIGIITDRDIVYEVLALDIPIDSPCVNDIMSYEMVIAREQDGLWESIQRMRSRGVRRMPVVDDKGSLVGIISVDDLLELLSDELSNLSQLITRELNDTQPQKIPL